jgi:1-phosphofructokinase
MIVTLTPNPALDRTLIVPGFRHGDVTRVHERHDAAGGKGLNVARALHTIGASYRAIAPLGGVTGLHIMTLAAAEGLRIEAVSISGETRTCLLITDPTAPDQLVVNEPGPNVNGSEWHALQTAVTKATQSATWLTISGSLPPGIAANDLRTLIEAIPATCNIALDTSGAPLQECMTAPIALLKINRDELAQAIGMPLIDTPSTVAAARQVVASGPRAVVVTMGAQGALAVSAVGAWFISAPPIRAVSPVGSGDCTLAGLVDALERGASLADALSAGVACGSANALAPHAGVFTMADVELFRSAAVIQILD